MYFVCHRDELLRQLFISIKQSTNDMMDNGLQDDNSDVLLVDTYDYEWLHEIGSGVDDCPLPHHISSDAEIIDLLERVKQLLSRLPRPAAVSIARLFSLLTSPIVCCHLECNQVQYS